MKNMLNVDDVRKVLGKLVGVCSIVAMTTTSAHGHGGGLARDGCHYDHQSGTRHCHRNSSVGDAGDAGDGLKYLGIAIIGLLIVHEITNNGRKGKVTRSNGMTRFTDHQWKF